MKHRSVLVAGMACLFIAAAGIASADEAAAPAADAKASKQEPQKKALPEAPKCTEAPGSHIRLAKPEDCSKVARGAYRSFSKEELESTGETDIGEALRKLDPRFR